MVLVVRRKLVIKDLNIGKQKRYAAKEWLSDQIKSQNYCFNSSFKRKSIPRIYVKGFHRPGQFCRTIILVKFITNQIYRNYIQLNLLPNKPDKNRKRQIRSKVLKQMNLGLRTLLPSLLVLLLMGCSLGPKVLQKDYLQYNTAVYKSTKTLIKQIERTFVEKSTG